MENQDNSLKDAFEKELSQMEDNTILSPEYRRRKTIAWAIRTTIAAALFYYFWDNEWVRWSLPFYIVFNLFGLAMIYGGSYMLNKKLDRTREKLEDFDQLPDEEKDE